VTLTSDGKATFADLMLPSAKLSSTVFSMDSDFAAIGAFGA